MSNRAVVVLACMAKNEATTDAIAANWKMSTDERRQLAWTVQNRDNIRLINLRAMQDMIVQGTDREWIYDLLEVREEYDLLKQLQEWETPVFPITGNDLIERGIQPGPELGNLLKEIKDVWITSGYEMDRDLLLTTAF